MCSFLPKAAGLYFLTYLSICLLIMYIHLHLERIQGILQQHKYDIISKMRAKNSKYQANTKGDNCLKESKLSMATCSSASDIGKISSH